jgi:hypothetical protein
MAKVLQAYDAATQILQPEKGQGQKSQGTNLLSRSA